MDIMDQLHIPDPTEWAVLRWLRPNKWIFFAKHKRTKSGSAKKQNGANLPLNMGSIAGLDICAKNMKCANTVLKI